MGMSHLKVKEELHMGTIELSNNIRRIQDHEMRVEVILVSSNSAFHELISV
jgi:hypothetical protein